MESQEPAYIETKSDGSDEPIFIPKVFKHYQYKAVIGKGTYAVVFLATDLKTKKLVAVKAIPRKQYEEYSSLAHLEKELRVLSRLKHRGIAEIYDTIFLSNLVLIVMQYCSGGDLCDYVISREHLSPSEVVEFLFQIVDTVRYIHSIDVVHRDIKLDNIVLDNHLQCKFIDFGLCNETHGKKLKTICGTTTYMAPEVLLDDDYDGKKADIWSIGVTTYVMAVGQPLFHDANEVVNVRLHNQRVQVPPTVNPFIAELIQEMCSPDPDDRPSASELYEILIEKCPLYISPPLLREANSANNKTLPSLQKQTMIMEHINKNLKTQKKFDVRINQIEPKRIVRPSASGKMNLLLDMPKALSRSAFVFNLKKEPK